MENYFEILGLETRIDLERSLLDKAFFALQNKYHPDMNINASEQDKILNYEYSNKINLAYNTLKKIMPRIEHYLALHGLLVKDAKASLTQELLLTTYGWREELELGNLGIINEVKNRHRNTLDACLKEIREGNLKRAFTLFLELAFSQRFINEVESE